MSSEPRYHCLTLEEWKNVTAICNYSETKVLYYILSENPMGDRVVDCRVRTIAQEMKLSIGAVSKAIKALEQKGLIGEVVITRAEVTIKPRIISNKAKEYLAKRNREEGKHLECETVSPSEHNVSPSEHNVSPSEHNVSPSEQRHLYKERARAKTNKTSLDSVQTVDVAATATEPAIEVEVLEPEALEEEQNTETLPSDQQCSDLATTREATHEEEYSAAPDAEILKQVERAAHSWRSRPWRASAQHFKPEMIRAVWQCNPGYYSLQGTQTPNQHHILKTLQLLERQLKSLDDAAVNAYHELIRYWQTAQILINPQVQDAFVAAADSSKKQAEEAAKQRRIQETLKTLEDL